MGDYTKYFSVFCCSILSFLGAFAACVGVSGFDPLVSRCFCGVCGCFWEITQNTLVFCCLTLSFLGVLAAYVGVYVGLHRVSSAIRNNSGSVDLVRSRRI